MAGMHLNSSNDASGSTANSDNTDQAVTKKERSCQPEVCSSCPPPSAPDYQHDGPQSRIFERQRYQYVRLVAGMGAQPTGSGLTYIQCPVDVPQRNCDSCHGYHPLVHHKEILIAIDGIMRQGRAEHRKPAGERSVARAQPTRAAVGVFFGQLSAYNFAQEIPVTNAEATQLKAAIHMLWAVANHVFRNHELDIIVIKTASPALFFGMTRKVFGWRQKGAYNADGSVIQNAEEWDEMETGMRWFAGKGIRIQFWLVARNDVSDARKMAESAF